MKETLKTILLGLFLLFLAAAAFYFASQHYILVLFDTIELPEWIFDVCAYGMGGLMGISGIAVLKSAFDKK